MYNFLKRFIDCNNMKKTNVFIKLNFIFIVFMFIGVAGHLQIFISIGWVGVIATYILNKDFSLIYF